LADDAEVIAIEYLDRIGHESLDDQGREWFLQVKAQINAVSIDDEYLKQLDRLAQVRKTGEGSPSRRAYLARLFEAAASGALGRRFQDLCRGGRDAIEPLLQLADEIDARVSEMPLVLCNPELDVGYRPGTDRRVCFDLHSTRLLPMYSDVRQIVGLPKGVQDGWGDAWYPRARWARAYVEAFNAVSPFQIHEDQVVDGARLLWMQHALAPGWSSWFLDRALGGEHGIRDCLLSVMTYLLEVV
jgi:hypothetical protein